MTLDEIRRQNLQMIEEIRKLEEQRQKEQESEDRGFYQGLLYGYCSLLKIDSAEGRLKIIAQLWRGCEFSSDELYDLLDRSYGRNDFRHRECIKKSSFWALMSSQSRHGCEHLGFRREIRGGKSYYTSIHPKP